MHYIASAQHYFWLQYLIPFFSTVNLCTQGSFILVLFFICDGSQESDLRYLDTYVLSVLVKTSTVRLLKSLRQTLLGCRRAALVEAAEWNLLMCFITVHINAVSAHVRNIGQVLRWARTGSHRVRLNFKWQRVAPVRVLVERNPEPTHGRVVVNVKVHRP